MAQSTSCWNAISLRVDSSQGTIGRTIFGGGDLGNPPAIPGSVHFARVADEG